MYSYAFFVALFGVSLAGSSWNRGSGGTPCPPLAIPNAVYDPQIASANSIAAGGRVRVSCANGFLNSGAEWLECGKDGKWKTAAWSTNAAPSCQASCEPPEIENAIFNPKTAADKPTPSGGRVEVSCEEGFEFIGESVIECFQGEFTGLEGAKCFLANESFCRDEALLPVVQGALATYGEDPLRAMEYINKAVLLFKGVQARGLSYLGLTPSIQYKSWETNAFYVPGITGSDATFQSLVLPNSFNLTAVPEQMEMGSVYCKVFDEENDQTAYVLKVLYKNNWGAFSLGNKKH